MGFSQSTTITISLDELIEQVSKIIGRDWKPLARKLEFEETEIDAIEDGNAQDFSEQIYRKWMLEKGNHTSNDVLLALKSTPLSEEKINALSKMDVYRSTTITNKQELKVKVKPGYQYVLSPPYLPTGDMNKPQESKLSFDLPGVEAVAHTHVIITNSSQTFLWDGYGFKLHIPQNSLPPGVDQCRLDIKASVAGNYQFPNNLQLVSGVFWVRPHPSGPFQQLLTVEIQHCAKMTSSTKLSFVRARCSQESLPYTFKQLEGRGSSFTEHSSYGSLELNQFSGLAVTGEDVERKYIASLYYFGSELHSREIHFIVNWNDEIHRSCVIEESPVKKPFL
ncbi:uncharacterized protein LOC135333630 isoform X1 [Halichondria panicea]|uniref:uncharacterized protein LOC135333630 isoform X1 n=1 Tax=Halichondria panicea TaxID=6063 RepID=UPI00312B5E7B